MKLKQIKFAERYVERLVLALAGVFFLLVFWFYFWGGPYTIDVPNKNPHATPADVEQLLRTDAQSLRSALNSPASNIPPMNVTHYAESFERAVIRPVIGVSEFDLPFGLPGLEQARFKFVDPPKVHYAVPTPVAPQMVRTQASHYVLADVNNAEIAKSYEVLIGNQQPRDFRAVTVWATYDVQAMAQRYRSAPENQRIPEDWWKNWLLVCDVVLERQTQDPVTGQWPDDAIVTIKPLPDAHDALQLRDLPPDPTNLMAEQLRREVHDDQDQLARPPFAPITPERVWNPPGESLSEDDRSKLAAIQQDIDDLKAKISASGGTTAQPAQPGPARGGAPPGAGGGGRGGPNGRPSSGPGRGGPGGGAGAGGDNTGGRPFAGPPSALSTLPTGSAGQTGRPANNDTEISSLNAQLRKKEEMKTALLQSGGIAHGGEAQPAEALGLPIWAHDVTVKPGATYRYRLSVGLFNPLFRNPALDPEQRKQFFNALYIVGDPSPWSHPVTIDQDSYFFAVGANSGKGTVDVEVWRIFNGHWRPQTFSVSPGDMIGKPKKLNVGNASYDVNFRLDATAVDIQYQIAGTKSGTSTAGLLVLNNASGKMQFHTVEEDRENLTRSRLRAESGTLSPVARAP